MKSIKYRKTRLFHFSVKKIFQHGFKVCILLLLTGSNVFAQDSIPLTSKDLRKVLEPLSDDDAIYSFTQCFNNDIKLTGCNGWFRFPKSSVTTVVYAYRNVQYEGTFSSPKYLLNLNKNKLTIHGIWKPKGFTTANKQFLTLEYDLLPDLSPSLLTITMTIGKTKLITEINIINEASKKSLIEFIESTNAYKVSGLTSAKQKYLDSIRQVQKQLEDQRKAYQDSISRNKKEEEEKIKLEQKRKSDSIKIIEGKRAEELRIRKQQTADSIARQKKQTADSLLKEKEIADALLKSKQRVADSIRLINQRITDSVQKEKQRINDSINILNRKIADEAARRKKEIADSIQRANQQAAEAQKLRNQKIADSIAQKKKEIADSILKANQQAAEAQKLRNQKIADSIARRKKEIADSTQKANQQAAEAQKLRNQKIADSIARRKKEIADSIRINKQITDSIQKQNQRIADSIRLRNQKIADSLQKQKQFIADSIAKAKLDRAPSFPPVQYGSLTDIDGFTYKTVRMGSQMWMAQNLNVTRFRNGDPIMEAQTLEEWRQADLNGTPAWCYYQEDAENAMEYGKLYNWHAVKDPRGLAPARWHVPTLEDWNRIIYYHGGAEKAGRFLKDSTGWYENGNGTGQTGFAARASGNRDFSGSFKGQNKFGYWWVNAEHGAETAWGCDMGYIYKNINLFAFRKGNGFAVRCVRD